VPSPDDAKPVIGRAFARPGGIARRTMWPPKKLLTTRVGVLNMRAMSFWSDKAMATRERRS
jgi:hypothetical protein